MFKTWEKLPAQSQLELDTFIAELRYNDDGLIPAIAQQHDTGEVLMMAWMNDRSIQETLNTGQVCYWSRSRQTYWRKGESSGHQQKLVSMRADCDGDTLLLLVDQKGPACHTNRRSCFFFEADQESVRVNSDVGSGL
ncbi:phosphoribosyl-AMP cyclohydrolase [Reinekea blandensis]|uniref:Phosphoribosyl-AMP cyclohydrolase n=1 Tax=Reinekea blandensis MED297 TaxID=314283 RepID=A4BJU1_9GAMM|nr:phosphoribosyl-AMP cyclohydrolase [Reinekea blandensis]EAR07608.1 Phosphoribosyl-AMP cyclohydrolase [Reinekea sp. MED297] [Reinekea blandensis MED297]